METIWRPRLEGKDGPLYRAIADCLAEDIDGGGLEAGARLPTMRALADAVGVTVGTVYRAYGLAEKRGLISREMGRGSFVRTHPSAARSEQAGAGEVLDLSRNQPPDVRVEETLRRALIDMGREADLSGMLDYGTSQGTARHRKVLARWLAGHGARFDPQSLIVTSGAQQALTVTLAALSRPGDCLLVEELTYPGIKSLARIFGLELRPLAIDDGGLRPEALEAALSETPPGRLLYCMPNAHNPTTATLDEARRREIARIAARADLLIVEDDVNPRLADDALPTLASLHPARTVYISSLSKIMAPGLRIGALAAPGELLDDLLAAAQTTNWMAPPLMAELACRWIEDGTADVLERERNQVIGRVQALAEAAFKGLDYRIAADNPNLWLKLGPRWQGADFAAMAESSGIITSPSHSFAIAPGTGAPAVRLSLTERDEALLRRGLKRLAELVGEGPRPLAFQM
jgi:DNA-binding transcriptional MocR family regulator